MLVLGRCVVKVLSSHNETSKEDAVKSTRHALCKRGQLCAEAVQVDKGGHERRAWHLGAVHKVQNELLKWRKVVERVFGGLKMLGQLSRGITRDHGASDGRQVGDHFGGDLGADKDIQCGGVRHGKRDYREC